MIDFEEELAKFKPSKEVDKTQDVIMSMNLNDMTDIMEEIIQNSKEQ